MAIGVQESDVWAAADAVLQTGEQPTIERVRLHLGRGSPNTVGPHLKSWFRGLSERLISRQGSHSGIPDKVTSAVAQIWETALVAAREEWSVASEAERIELNNLRDALAAEGELLTQDRDRLRVREVDLHTYTQAARAQVEASEARLQAAEAQIVERAQTLKELNTELAAAYDEVSTLQRSLQTAQTSHQEALAAMETRHTAHERRWLNEVDELRQALKKTQEEREQGRKAIETMAARHQQALDQARADTDIQRQRAVTAETRMQVLTTQLEAEMQASRSVQAHWESATAQLTAQIGALHDQVQIKDRQLELLMQSNKRRRRAVAAHSEKGEVQS